MATHCLPSPLPPLLPFPISLLFLAPPPTKRVLVHRSTTPVHSLTSIVLDGTVCDCNSPAAARTLGVHHGEVAQSYFSAFFGQSTGHGQGAGRVYGEARGACFAANLANGARSMLYM